MISRIMPLEFCIPLFLRFHFFACTIINGGKTILQRAGRINKKYRRKGYIAKLGKTASLSPVAHFVTIILAII